MWTKRRWQQIENIETGFDDLAADLAAIAGVVTDERIQAKALEAGAKPIVSHAKSLAPRGNTGRLTRSIGAQYSERSKSVRIGIGEPVSTTNSSTGFYGRFQNDGWRPAGGRRIQANSTAAGRRLDKRSKRAVGVVRGRDYLGAALDAQKNNAFNIIIDELKNALK